MINHEDTMPLISIFMLSGGDVLLVARQFSHCFGLKTHTTILFSECPLARSAIGSEVKLNRNLEFQLRMWVVTDKLGIPMTPIEN
jgi:hypothetical protein